MDSPLHIGTVTLRPDLSLPIVDCKSWYVTMKQRNCRKGLDVDACATCAERESRNGDLRNPPIYGRGEATKQPLAPVAPAAQPAPTERIRGLGDVVHKVTSKLRIRECGGCKKRREALNRLVPFGDKEAGK